MNKLSGVIATIFLAIIYFSISGCHSSKESNPSAKVYINKSGDQYKLYKNGQPYLIKGGAGYDHLEKLKEIGGNTIKTWDTVNLQNILDKAHQQGIAVIAGLSMPKSKYLDEFYLDSTKVTKQYEAFKKTVNRFKDHPALLMWSLGNEVDFYFHPRYRPFYKVYNSLLAMIHREDPDHPVTTSLPYFGEKQIINIVLKVPDLDVISINIFGALTDFKENLASFSWFWNGPFFISEWGASGWWEVERTAWGAPIEPTTRKKAEQIRERYKNALPHHHPGFLGSLVFYWGHKFEVTPTWFSLFSNKGAAAEGVTTLHQLWQDSLIRAKIPSIKYMLLENQSSQEDLIFQPNEKVSAQLKMKKSGGDSIITTWKILPEDWYEINQNNIIYPDPVNNLFVSQNKLQAEFRTPATEGPYRIYAMVHDQNGHFSSTNVPFYILD